MKKIKNMAGYGVIGYVEVDDLGRIVCGRLGVKVYGKKKDIEEEGFAQSNIAKAMLLVDTPKKLRNRKDPRT